MTALILDDAQADGVYLSPLGGVKHKCGRRAHLAAIEPPYLDPELLDKLRSLFGGIREQVR